MSVNAFVDTHILVYSRDAGAVEKQQKAESLIADLWKTRCGRISVQILNEYFVTVTKKLKPGMPEKSAWADVLALKSWEPIAMNWKLLEKGRTIFERSTISWLDSLVVAAAQASNCDILYSEDLSHGQIYGDVTVINPFN